MEPPSSSSSFFEEELERYLEETSLLRKHKSIIRRCLHNPILSSQILPRIPLCDKSVPLTYSTEITCGKFRTYVLTNHGGLYHMRDPLQDVVNLRPPESFMLEDEIMVICLSLQIHQGLFDQCSVPSYGIHDRGNTSIMIPPQTNFVKYDALMVNFMDEVVELNQFILSFLEYLPGGFAAQTAKKHFNGGRGVIGTATQVPITPLSPYVPYSHPVSP